MEPGECSYSMEYVYDLSPDEAMDLCIHLMEQLRGHQAKRHLLRLHEDLYQHTESSNVYLTLRVKTTNHEKKRGIRCNPDHH